MDRPPAADVVAAASGDVAAFERLVRATQGYVWRYIVHLLGDRGLAEDVAQEVFLRAHRKLASLRDPERFMPWLVTIARNAAYDAGRARRRSRIDLSDNLDATAAATGSDPHLSIEVVDALNRLDSTLREALVLVAMLGFTYDEAARSLGVPAGTVKSRVFRARSHLAVSLDRGADHA